MKSSVCLVLLCVFSLVVSAQEWDFQDGDLHGFVPANFSQTEVVPGKGWIGTGNARSIFYSPVLEIDAEVYKVIELDMDAGSRSMSLYFARPDSDMSEAQVMRFSPTNDYPRIYIDFTEHPEWHGTVSQFRVDPISREGQRVVIRSIRLLKEHPAKNGARTGILVNGAFQYGLARWNGEATLEADGGAVLAPGKEIVSDAVELFQISEMEWEAECEGEWQSWCSAQDILGREVPGTAPSGKTSGAFRPDERTATLQMHIRNTGSTPLRIRRIYLAPNRGTGLPLGGNWIMDPDTPADGHSANLFQCEVMIPDDDALDYALLAATADDILACRVNGHPLVGFRGANLWSSVDCFDVTRFLFGGKNIFLFRTENLGGPGGLLAQVILVWKDGTRTVYDSSSDWLSATIPLEDEFWERQRVYNTPVVLAKAGESPWCPLTYNEASDVASILEEHNMPRNIRQQETWTPHFRIRIPGGEHMTQRQDLELSLYLVRERTRILLAERLFPAHYFDGKSSAEFELDTVYFRYLMPGEYQVQCTLGSNCMDATALPETLRILQEAPLETAIPVSTLTDRATQPRISLNGGPASPLTHYLLDGADSPEFYRNVKRALDSGISGIWIHTVFDYLGNGEIDLTNVENMLQSILARSPDAHIFLTPLLDSSETIGFQKNFLDSHPEAVCLDGEGNDHIPLWNGRARKCPSMASEEWLSECELLFRTLVRRLDRTPWAQRLAGIIPCSGLSYEWMYWGSQTPGCFTDYGPAFRKAFAEFARGKYRTIAEVNRRWNTHFSRFDEIAIPTPEERMAMPAGYLKCPAQDQYTIDFVECLAEVDSKAVVRLCHCLKEASGGRLLTGAYYGYMNYITDGDFAQKSGHWNLQHVLRSPDVDLLMSPTKYSDRMAGGAGGFMIPIGSVHLHDKVYIDESDIRTPHSEGDYQACNTLRDACAVFMREFGAVLSTRNVFRAYDFSKGWVFGDTRLAQLFAELVRAEARLHEEGIGTVKPAEVIAVVNADNAAAFTVMESPLNQFLVSRQYEEFPRTGCPFLTYLLSDLEQIPSAHRFWIFENAFRLTKEQRKYIREKLMVPGKTILFTYAADVIEDQAIRPEGMTALLGMEFRQDDRLLRRRGILSEKGEEILGKEGEKNFAFEEPVAPIFFPVAECTVLATDEDGNAVLAETEVNACRVIFSSMPGIRSSWLRAFAQAAGIRCVNPTQDDVTWTDGTFIAIHTAAGGTRTLHAGCQEGMATELLTGKEYPIQDGAFSYEAAPMSSALFLVR